MKKILFLLVIFCMCVSNCFSYVLVKTIKGDEIYGSLVSENTEQLTVKTQKGDVTVKKSEIKSFVDFEQKDSGMSDNNLSYKPQNRLSLINSEIFKTEEKMEASKFKVYAPLIFASLGAGVVYYIDSRDNKINPGLITIEIIALTTSVVLSGMGLLEYWDAVNTAAELRAKRYDIMNLPLIKKDPLAFKIGCEFRI
jgi:hypothetical protein